MTKKFYIKSFIILFCLHINTRIEAQNLPEYNLQSLSNTHNVKAPDWGPYSKKYAGISHIADSKLGTRFDFSVAAGFFKGKVIVPNAKYISGYHPWNASSDLESYSFREEIEWKDKVYADISFTRYNKHARLMKIELVNNTNELHGLSLNFMASLLFDNMPIKAELPKNRIWTSAIDYKTLTYRNSRPDDNLRTDALLKGESRNNNFTGGSGLGDNFGKDSGDKVIYNIPNTVSLQNAQLIIRYKVAKNESVIFKSIGLYSNEIELKGTGEFAQKVIPIGKLNNGIRTLELIAQSSVPIELDGFCLLEKEEVEDLKFILPLKNPVPSTDIKSAKQGIVLKYKDLQQYCGICWDADVEASVREVKTDDYDNAIKGATDFLYEHNYAVRQDDYTSNVYLRSFNIPAQSKQVFYTLLCQGTKEETLAQMESFLKDEKLADFFASKPTQLNYFETVNPEGKEFLFSQERMKATMLQNIVYPLYAERETIKQFVPGKRWNSLYTWDSGFIGLGMLEIDVQRAIEVLNGYTNPSTAENAYIHHGSLVPVQFFLYQDIWNKTQSKELLGYFYDRLKNYYLFFTGKYGSSTTRKLKSNLLNTFDYFYNSGGWDDYPAQNFARNNKMYNEVAPVISTSMAIRIAKIMQTSADMLGIKKDQDLYKNDIEMFSKALQENSWDEASGYFGYVVHDPKTLLPTGILRDKQGVNHNMGVDGIYPLVAGICTPDQKAKAMEHLFSPKQCWTPLGITVVDQSAPYFSVDGYWNGTVWFPHQYIIWKTMLDLGEGKRASQIAQTALKLYQKEVDSTYNCPELVRMLTKHSFGWHQFSGLSAPVLNWFGAYYRPGSINVGYDGWIVNKSFTLDNTNLKTQLQFSTKEKDAGVLICMKSGKKYTVLVNGKPTPYDETVSGSLFIKVPIQGNKKVNISIKAV
jgi:hypothetical protein